MSDPLAKGGKKKQAAAAAAAAAPPPAAPRLTLGGAAKAVVLAPFAMTSAAVGAVGSAASALTDIISGEASHARVSKTSDAMRPSKGSYGAAASAAKKQQQGGKQQQQQQGGKVLVARSWAWNALAGEKIEVLVHRCCALRQAARAPFVRGVLGDEARVTGPAAAPLAAAGGEAASASLSDARWPNNAGRGDDLDGGGGGGGGGGMRFRISESSPQQLLLQVYTQPTSAVLMRRLTRIGAAPLLLGTARVNLVDVRGLFGVANWCELLTSALPFFYLLTYLFTY